MQVTANSIPAYSIGAWSTPQNASGQNQILKVRNVLLIIF
jgi:hypothetical protein